ncbi:MAG: 50S ribosomal protein L21 [Propionibacteriales bacterium]|nr:50S ribosomal protein L21 [Propionibacteriales bacterium]
MYAIVRSGGQQHKVAVGDVLDIDKLPAVVGDSLTLPAVLLVDGDTVTADAQKLAKVSVEAEVLGETKGPKINILKYKNKTGYRRRQGHRQRYTQIKVTNIKTGGRTRKSASGGATKSKRTASKDQASSSED